MAGQGINGLLASGDRSVQISQIPVSLKPVLPCSVKVRQLPRLGSEWPDRLHNGERRLAAGGFLSRPPQRGGLGYDSVGEGPGSVTTVGVRGTQFRSDSTKSPTKFIGSHMYIRV